MGYLNRPMYCSESTEQSFPSQEDAYFVLPPPVLDHKLLYWDNSKENLISRERQRQECLQLELLSEKFYYEAITEVFNVKYFLRLMYLEKNLKEHKQF